MSKCIDAEKLDLDITNEDKQLLLKTSVDMTKEDYMKLPKERLAELLVEMEEKFSQPIVIPNMPTIPTTPPGLICDGTHCTNPQMDCINCPRRVTGGMFNTQSHTSTLKAEGNTSVTDGKPHNPSFID